MKAEFQPQVLHSPEAEKAVLGCMLGMPHEVIPDICLALNKGDFFLLAHQTIYEGIVEIYLGAVIALDVMTLHQWLTDKKKAVEVGSPGILAELLVGFATHLNVSSYVKIVKDKSLLRKLVAACTHIIQDVQDMPDSVPEVLDRAESAIFRITNRELSGNDIKDAPTCVAMVREMLDEVEAGKATLRVKTGIKAIDEINGGIPSPGYILFVGSPGIGKTAIASNLMDSFCIEGIGTAMFSLEMTIQMLMKRKIARAAKIDSARLNGKLHPREQEDVELAMRELADWPFWIDDTPYLTATDFATKARQMAKRGAKVIILDYVQLTKGRDNRDHRSEQLAEFSRTITLVRKELGIIIIVLANVNKDGQKGLDLLPEHIADSHAMYKDCDVCLMMQQAKDYDRAPISSKPVLVRCPKYRDGRSDNWSVIIEYNARELSFT